MHVSFKLPTCIFLATLASAAPIAETIEQNVVLEENLVEGTNLTTRQAGGPDGTCLTPHREKKWVLANNADPHQNFVFKQITDSNQCRNSPGSSVSSTEGLSVGVRTNPSLILILRLGTSYFLSSRSESYDMMLTSIQWSFSIGGSISATPPGTSHGAGGSVDIGYSVSKSTTTTIGRSFGCSTDDGSQDGSVCGFERVQVTALTMKEVDCPVKCPWDSVDIVDPKFCKDTGSVISLPGYRREAHTELVISAPTMVALAPNGLQGGGTDGKGPACHYSNFQLGLPCVVVGNEVHTGPSSIPGGPQFVSCDDGRCEYTFQEPS